jgi:hypothetical protein
MDSEAASNAPTMKLRHIGGLLVALGALSVATANAEERAVKLAGLDVTVWSPKSDDVGGLPVIVFSHGFHGCATRGSHRLASHSGSCEEGEEGGRRLSESRVARHPFPTVSPSSGVQT